MSTSGDGRATRSGWGWRWHHRANLPGGIGALLWLVVVAVPVYFIVVTSLRSSQAYLSDGAISVPSSLGLGSYRRALHAGFGRFLGNSVVVTLATVTLVFVAALPCAYAIVRGAHSRALRMAFSVFLLGLAVPAQAVIIPIYLIITRMHMYDSLIAIILPTASFSLPMAIVVLTSALRDIPNELYEAMAVDGASPRQVFTRLVVPMSIPGLITAGIFSGLNAWNGIIFPLVLTQSYEQRVLPLGLWNFQGQYGTDVPGLMAAVVLTALPVLALYLFGRRYLLSGLTAGYSR